MSTAHDIASYPWLKYKIPTDHDITTYPWLNHTLWDAWLTPDLLREYLSLDAYDIMVDCFQKIYKTSTGHESFHLACRSWTIGRALPWKHWDDEVDDGARIGTTENGVDDGDRIWMIVNCTISARVCLVPRIRQGTRGSPLPYGMCG